MSHQNSNVFNEHDIANSEIDLAAIFSVIWRKKWISIISMLVAAIIGAVYAVSLPNIYKSEVILAPADESSMKNFGQLGGLASLAGVDLNGGGVDKTKIALETLKSRSFLMQFIEDNNLKVKLIAANGWDRSSDTLLFDDSLYNETTNTWVREVSPPRRAEPSLLEAQEEFLSNNLFISVDSDTGLIVVGVKYYSPKIAKEIVEKLIYSINKRMRTNDIADAELSIKYLNNALENTNIVDMKIVLNKLVEEQYQTKMLATVRKDYVLKVIDPPVIEEVKSTPRRGGIIIVFLTIGFLFGLTISLLTNKGSKNA